MALEAEEAKEADEAESSRASSQLTVESDSRRRDPWRVFRSLVTGHPLHHFFESV